MKRSRMIVAGILLALLPSAVFADALRYDGLDYNNQLTVMGIKDGQLQATINGNDKLFDLDKVEWIELSNQPTFNKAEHARKDAKAAAGLYKSALNNINDRRLKVLAQLRAVGPMDADGKFTEAMNYFLDAYAASPTDSIWDLRPTHIPAPPSTMLKTAADDIARRVASFRSEDAKKNLETMELDLLTKAGDPRAGALAKKLGTGTVDETPAVKGGTPAQAAPAPVSAGEGLQGVSNAVKSKAYDAAITQADQMLKTATGETAVRLFELKAQALVGQKKLEEASATYLRVLAHYPSSPNVIQDLQKAADLQKALNHPDEAKRLTDEITNIRNAPKN